MEAVCETSQRSFVNLVLRFAWICGEDCTSGFDAGLCVRAPTRLFFLLSGKRGTGRYVGGDLGKRAVVRWGMLDTCDSGRRCCAGASGECWPWLRGLVIIEVLTHKCDVDKAEVYREVSLWDFRSIQPG